MSKMDDWHGEWTPEPRSEAASVLGVSASILLASDRPGAVEPGTRPVTRLQFNFDMRGKWAKSVARIHAEGVSCGHNRAGAVYATDVRNVPMFGLACRDEPNKVCQRCKRNVEQKLGERL